MVYTPGVHVSWPGCRWVNHNKYLSIPYKVPRFILPKGEERERNTGKEEEWRRSGIVQG